MSLDSEFLWRFISLLLPYSSPFPHTLTHDQTCWQNHLLTQIDLNRALRCSCPVFDCPARPTRSFFVKVFGEDTDPMNKVSNRPSATCEVDFGWNTLAQCYRSNCTMYYSQYFRSPGVYFCFCTVRYNNNNYIVCNLSLFGVSSHLHFITHVHYTIVSHPLFRLSPLPSPPSPPVWQNGGPVVRGA